MARGLGRRAGRGAGRGRTQSFAGLPLWRSVYRAVEPVGVDALDELAVEVYAGADPLADPAGTGPLSITRTAAGAVLQPRAAPCHPGGRRPGPPR